MSGPKSRRSNCYQCEWFFNGLFMLEGLHTRRETHTHKHEIGRER